MQLSDHDLKQLDDDYLRSLPAEALRTLSSKLLSDLKEAHDRLNQNPSNSSRPPSSRAPWEKTEETSQDDGEDDDVPQDAASDAAGDRKRDDEVEKGKQDKEQSDPKQTESRDTKPGRPGGVKVHRDTAARSNCRSTRSVFIGPRPVAAAPRPWTTHASSGPTPPATRSIWSNPATAATG